MILLVLGAKKRTEGFFQSYSCAFLGAVIQLSSPSLHIEEGVAAAKGLEAGEVTGRLVAGRGRSRVPGRVLGFAGCFVAISRILAASAGAELNFVDDDNGHALLRIGLLIFPGVLVVTTGQVDARSFLQIHLADPITEAAKSFDAQVDPSVILVCTGIVHLRPDPEANEVALIGKLQCGCVVGAFGDDNISCEKL